MNINIIPGSFKPPHKGHLSLVENIIKRNSINDMIVIIISKKPRCLDKSFLYVEQKSKLELQNALIKYLPLNETHILQLTKEKILILIKELIEKKVLKTINAEQSYNIWSIYIKYLKKKYKTMPKIVLRIAENNNIMLDTDRVIVDIFRKRPVIKGVYLMKSMKNEKNSRFNFLERKYKKYIKTLLFKNIKDIDATEMREHILNKNKKGFMNYLPKNMSEYSKNKI